MEAGCYKFKRRYSSAKRYFYVIGTDVAKRRCSSCERINKSRFCVSRLSGRLCGEFLAKGKNFPKTISLVSGFSDCIKNDDLILTRSFNTIVDRYNTVLYWNYSVQIIVNAH